LGPLKKSRVQVAFQEIKMQKKPDIVWIMTIVFVLGSLVTGIAQSALV